MAWAKLDDRFHENRKIRRVWRRCPAAIGLHVLAITYCAGHLTDGLVDEEFVEERMPAKRDRDRAVGELVAASLWHETDCGWQIHDFAEFNMTREKAKEERDAKAVAGRKGAAKRWGNSSNEAPALAPAIGGASPELKQVSDPRNGSEPEPDPNLSRTLKPPDPPRGKRARDQEKYRAELDAWVAENPTTDELAQEWGVLKAQMRERHGDSLMMSIDYLHPHHLGDAPVFGSNVGGDPGRCLDHRHPSILHDALGVPPVLIDCQCELTRECAA